MGVKVPHLLVDGDVLRCDVLHLLDELPFSVVEVPAPQKHKQLRAKDEAGAAAVQHAALGRAGRKDWEAVVGAAPEDLTDEGDVLEGPQANNRRGHDVAGQQSLKLAGRLQPQEIDVPILLQLALIHSVVVNVICHPVGDHDGHNHPKDELDPTGALHHNDYEANGGPEHPAQHARGPHQSVDPGVDLPGGGQKLLQNDAEQTPDRRADHDGGHEHACWDSKAGAQAHQAEVRQAEDGKRLRSELARVAHADAAVPKLRVEGVCKLGFVRGGAAAVDREQVLDGRVGVIEEGRGKVVVLPFRAAPLDPIGGHLRVHAGVHVSERKEGQVLAEGLLVDLRGIVRGSHT
mmetsp:Transcript_36922/g.104190  ORF Transcript_36922/g.104190 Transcript_36922/m.104190 type:complete len:347 (+) Transcript_36922:569-1609(+)